MDCTFATDEGKFNFRVGVLIKDDTRILMAHNPNETYEYFYSVGGRVHFGETLEEAAKRELREETGLELELDRMIALHENYFEDGNGVPYHEISAFFLVKMTDELRAIADGHLTDQGPLGEHLQWINLENCEGVIVYPEFFKTWNESCIDVMHVVTRES